MSNSINSLRIARLDEPKKHFSDLPKDVHGRIVTRLFEDVYDKIMLPCSHRDKKTSLKAIHRIFAIAQVCKYTYDLVYNQLVPGEVLVRWPRGLVGKRANNMLSMRDPSDDSHLKFQCLIRLFIHGFIPGGQALAVAVASRNTDNLRTCLQIINKHSKDGLNQRQYDHPHKAALSIARKNNDFEMIQLLSQDEENAFGSLCDAARSGHLKIAQALLLETRDPDADRSRAIVLAASYGHLYTVLGLLQESSNPDADRRSAHSEAYQMRERDIATALRTGAVLLPQLPLEPDAERSKAIQNAVIDNQLYTVLCLLQETSKNPKADKSLALSEARRCGHMDIIAALSTGAVLPQNMPRINPETIFRGDFYENRFPTNPNA